MDLPSPAALERVLLASVDREPDSEEIDRPDWVQVRTPSSRRPNHNKVLRARLTPQDADAAIARVAAEHAQRGAACSLFVGPSSTPDDLGQRLLDHGFARVGPTLGMARVIGDEDLAIDIPGLTVREVKTPEDVELFCDVTALAWERGAQFREAVAHITHKNLRIGAPTRSWTASLHGEPVAASHLRVLPDCGYLQGCAVVPKHRRHGIYRALVHHRLDVLRSMGTNVAVIFAAADTSGQGCKKLGFSTVCEAEFYESKGP